MATVDVRSVPLLQRFLLTNIRSTGAGTFGSGSAAVELEMEGSGLICVGKEVHVTSIATFVEECALLFDLRHPHIIQYLGLSVSRSNSLLVVMEYMPHTFDYVLKNAAELPLALKHSILFDVARGLEYLHCRPSPIVHGKLTATNILVNSAMVAKISDIGAFLHLSDTDSMVSYIVGFY
jgi:serine/threonine protein kinase